MKYCPECRVEYQDWAEKCKDCGALLASGEMPEAVPTSPTKEILSIVCLNIYAEESEAMEAQGRLLEKGIASMITDTGLLNSSELHLFGTGLMLLVRQDQSVQAAQILSEKY